MLACAEPECLTTDRAWIARGIRQMDWNAAFRSAPAALTLLSIRGFATGVARAFEGTRQHRSALHRLPGGINLADGPGTRYHSSHAVGQPAG